MRAINKRAQVVMDVLIEGLRSRDPHKKLDNGSGFMPVVVELIGATDAGPIYSVAHYGELNSDLMRDPEMTFLKGSDGRFYPLDFRNDYAGVWNECVEFDRGNITGWRPKAQKDLAIFAGIWMQNIKYQQTL